jgi:hypothetical protein
MNSRQAMISSTRPANHSPGRDARERRARAHLDYLVPDDFTQVSDWL